MKTSKEIRLINANKCYFSRDKYIDFFYKHSKEKNKFHIFILDIQKFRYYNYVYGYDYGDLIINSFFESINNRLKYGSEIYRFSADKIILLIEDEEKENTINVLKEFDGKLSINNDEIKIEIKAGISTYPDDSDKPDIVLKYSEIALNYAKQQTREKYKIFKENMYNYVIKTKEAIDSIEKAVDRKEFIVYYQPLIDSKLNIVYGMEALIRWDKKELGILSPAYFIDILENTGMIIEVGKFVFEEACKKLKQCEEIGHEDLSISINVAEIQFEEKDFLSFIEKTIKDTNVNPKKIIIEITERILMSQSEYVIETLQKIREKGIKIYIDDFGTKYSSLNYLFRFPIDGIKIDKSFIDKINESKKELTIVKNIINLAEEIGIEVVAEGVEEKRQLESLIDINCNKIQGYIFSKPIDSNEIINYLNKFTL
ncbi:diguanylate cyclase (GGDEF) domain-containing protein [Clostridium acidisoli DSM 12555]|uniref:Diguanylate cyclase (GGDEF) domain-containing protein n=1 Tax=Clostridium acidisoli DSM 12555 TaxID=1121291 RepID=A0A1W1XET8_9CLOT|nr:bifunctional diguanylate cyclase/phosphodiesterase [Clostridium acidisoli]SMC22575.1 diguanylate cyclase (GGDEF) domain-containing protein [Clostridium acidisoli DSM 12555]